MTGDETLTGHSVIINDGSDRTQDFAITSNPSVSDNDRLIQDFIVQAESLPSFPDPQQRTYSSGFEIEGVLPLNRVSRYNEYLSIWRTNKKDDFSSEYVAKVLNNVFQRAATEDFSVTVVMMPTAASKLKRATNAWGTYSLPSKEARRQNPEAILSSNPEPSTSPNPQVPDLEDFPVIVQQAEDKSPVRGILPSCFGTLAACQKRTHSCSSHGECQLLHKGRGSGSNKESVDCYGCACTPTIEHIDEDKGMESKRKVTYWGGPACQKKDISVQFWLFVLTGVTLAFLVSAGIGMLYTMGSEELPSVIGAGVSGPVRK